MTLPFRKHLRRVRMGMQTVLGLGARGFFTPYRYAEGVRPLARYDEIEAHFAARTGTMTDMLASLDALAEPFQAIGAEPPPAPRWDQAWFAPLDAAVAYAMVAREGPKRIVEVGSGHSTRFLARALKDCGASAEHVCIDPAPRAALDGLPIRWENALLSVEHLSEFDALGDGDIAFFDSSHILWPGLDVDLIFNRILPRLKRGVRVHIHDVFLPDAYPKGWEWRGYTEQNALGGWMMGGAYEVEFAGAYAVTRMGALSHVAGLSRHPEAIDSSLWMRRI